MNMPTNRMNISESELWQDLYSQIPKDLQEGEKTVRMMIEESGTDVDFKVMKKRVVNWVKEGKLKSVGTRMYEGHPAEAYVVL